jgi:NDP-sugar pyrophosphorylase family protein
MRVVYPRLLEQQPDAIAAFESHAEFLDVGTARDYLATVATIAAREQRPFDVGADCRIAPDAQLDRTVVWDRVAIGEGARLSDCIVADDVTIPAGAGYQGQVLVNTASGLAPSEI